MIIAEYDLDDNIIDVFDSYKELAEEFRTSLKTVHCMVCRQASGEIEKSYDKTKGIYVKLYKIKLESELDYEETQNTRRSII